MYKCSETYRIRPHAIILDPYRPYPTLGFVQTMSNYNSAVEANKHFPSNQHRLAFLENCVLQPRVALKIISHTFCSFFWIPYLLRPINHFSNLFILYFSSCLCLLLCSSASSFLLLSQICRYFSTSPCGTFLLTFFLFRSPYSFSFPLTLLFFLWFLRIPPSHGSLEYFLWWSHPGKDMTVYLFLILSTSILSLYT